MALHSLFALAAGLTLLYALIGLATQSLHLVARATSDLLTPLAPWKDELAWVAGYMRRWFICLHTVIHPGPT